MKGFRLLLCAVVVAMTGCYHATIETGLPPSSQVVSQQWAASWVYGLVPPKVVNVAGQCPGGVARVETQLSFLNQLVGMLTLGIFTPMTIEVTCASGGTGEVLGTEPDLTVAHPEDEDAVRDVLQQAASLSVSEKRPVYVQF